ncbi:MAG: carboxymuconolactone decarboxylase family protein [Candidatus Asgardarchaeia archaeon]
MLKVNALNLNALSSHLNLYRSTMFDDSPLSRKERESIAVFVSSLNGCIYCIKHHSEALRRLGVGEDYIELLIKNPEGIRDEKIVEMLNYSKKLTEKPSSISEEDVRGLRRVGLTDREILDLTLVVAYFNFVNRIALGLGVELEPDFEKTCKEDFG